MERQQGAQTNGHKELENESQRFGPEQTALCRVSISIRV